MRDARQSTNAGLRAASVWADLNPARFAVAALAKVAVWRAAAPRPSLTVLNALYRILGVGSRRALSLGVVASVALASCGGSSQKTSTAATSAPAAPASSSQTYRGQTSQTFL